MIIGIDLGTTFSVIAVPGRVQNVSGYPEPRYVAECNVSILSDPFGNYIIPSVLWEDESQPDVLIVGVPAKDAADEGFSPIMFSKRTIGTNILHPLGKRHYTARQVASELLIYLKTIAEQALGQPVDRAVITHPAYFDPAMREETALAAQDAGFDFRPEIHLLMEPIAAALAYTYTDPRDPLRTLTYDLGGGTFDATVMERRRGVITVKAFGGNRLLGGFNFDRELARWLLQRLKEHGVQITFDENRDVNRGQWSRLLRLAEDTKIKLAATRTDKMPVQIKQQNIFSDDQGHSINLLEQITREQFVALIQDFLDDTIFGMGGGGATEGCNLVLAKAGCTIDQIDEILLVGGSSAGPWVAKTIEKAWQREVRLFEPDLCVAIGAAIQARTVPVAVQSSAYRLELDYPRQSVLDTVNIAGRVAATQQPGLPDGLRAVLNSPGAREQQVAVTPSGSFLFEEIVLQEASAMPFTLTICDPQNRELATHRFEIIHTAEEKSEGIGFLTVLPKPLFIEGWTGMKAIAEEGAFLPAQCEIELVRTNEEDSIEIRLFQEQAPIGSVLIHNVPKEAPIGAKVKVMVEISPSNRITGRATVFTRKGAVAAEAPVDIRIPPLLIPDLMALRSQFDDLENERSQRIDLERNPEVRMRLRAKGDKINQKVEKLLADPTPDRQEIWLALRNLRKIIDPPQEDMDPSLEYFEAILLRVREALTASSINPQLQAYSGMVERLENEGRVAYSKKDRRRWAQTNSGLETLLQRLTRGDKAEAEQTTPPTILQKLQVKARLDQLYQLLRKEESTLLQENKLERLQQRINRLREKISQIEHQVEQIDNNLDPRSTESQIQLFYYQELQPLEKQIQTLRHDVDIVQ